MANRPLTWTGRGLRLAYAGEFVLGAAAVLYLLSRSGRLAALGFLLAAAFGVLSIRKMWGGRREFGPQHQRNANRGFVLFWLAALLFSYALIGALTTLPETLVVRDLQPPILAAGLGLALETASGALLLWHLCGARRRAWVAGYAALGALLGILLAVYGILSVNELREAAGERLSSPGEARIRLTVFLDEVLPVVMVAFLATRAAAAYLVQLARREVAVAEADAEAAEATEPSPAP